MSARSASQAEHRRPLPKPTTIGIGSPARRRWTAGTLRGRTPFSRRRLIVCLIPSGRPVSSRPLPTTSSSRHPDFGQAVDPVRAFLADHHLESLWPRTGTPTKTRNWTNASRSNCRCRPFSGPVRQPTMQPLEGRVPALVAVPRELKVVLQPGHAGGDPVDPGPLPPRGKLRGGRDYPLTRARVRPFDSVEHVDSSGRFRPRALLFRATHPESGAPALATAERSGSLIASARRPRRSGCASTSGTSSAGRPPRRR
jgi:hypothetical protein